VVDIYIEVKLMLIEITRIYLRIETSSIHM
jgi:hypothetical protein